MLLSRIIGGQGYSRDLYLWHWGQLTPRPRRHCCWSLPGCERLRTENIAVRGRTLAPIIVAGQWPRGHCSRRLTVGQCVCVCGQVSACVREVNVVLSWWPGKPADCPGRAASIDLFPPTPAETALRSLAATAAAVYRMRRSWPSCDES